MTRTQTRVISIIVFPADCAFHCMCTMQSCDAHRSLSTRGPKIPQYAAIGWQCVSGCCLSDMGAGWVCWRVPCGCGRLLRRAAMLRKPITIVLRECRGACLPPQPPTLVTAGTLKPDTAALVLTTILCPCHHPTPSPYHHPSPSPCHH